MVRALGAVADVTVISTSDVRTALIDRVAARLSRKLYLWEFGLATSRRHGRAATRRVKDARPDVVFAVAASTDVAHLAGDVPVVQYIDAAFDDMKDQYAVFSGVSRVSEAQIRKVGRRAKARTVGYVAASEWAAAGLTDAGIAVARVVVAPPGAAIMPRDVERVGGGGAIRALVVSSDWERKGGDRAVAAIAQARAAGVDIQLTVVGNAPELPDWVTVTGRLTQQELSDQYLAADVLLELARANAAGVTLTDAAAHGLPALATWTGGVASIVEDGRSGWLIANDESAVAAASDRLGRLAAGDWGTVTSEGTRGWYDERLAWGRWAETVISACARASQERVR